MIRRHAFQRTRAPSVANATAVADEATGAQSGRSFLSERLVDALSCNRIAGYFDSLLQELGGEPLEGVLSG